MNRHERREEHRGNRREFEHERDDGLELSEHRERVRDVGDFSILDFPVLWNERRWARAADASLDDVDDVADPARVERQDDRGRRRERAVAHGGLGAQRERPR